MHSLLVQKQRFGLTLTCFGANKQQFQGLYTNEQFDKSLLTPILLYLYQHTCSQTKQISGPAKFTQGLQ